MAFSVLTPLNSCPPDHPDGKEDHWKIQVYLLFWKVVENSTEKIVANTSLSLSFDYRNIFVSVPGISCALVTDFMCHVANPQPPILQHHEKDAHHPRFPLLLTLRNFLSTRIS
jgi:hypothetical protein